MCNFRAKFVTVILFIAFTNLSVAGEKGGGDASGGGGGVRDGQAIYMLDLYEAGLHLNPYFEHSANDSEFESDLKSAQLPEGTPLQHLSRKLQDIEVIEPYLAAALLEAIKTLTWRELNRPIEETNDFGQNFEKLKIVQIANRQGSVVQVQKSLWDLMNAENRTALIIHEALAALRPPAAHKNQGPLRRVVAWLFDESFYNRTLNYGKEALAGFPSFFEAQKRYPSILQRNFTRVHVVVKETGLTLEARARFILSPQAEFVWSDRRSNMEKFLSKPNEEYKTTYVVPGFFDLAFIHYCDLPRKDLQLDYLRLTYYRMQVTPTSFEEDGNSYPMLRWSLKVEDLASLDFLPARSNKKANCGPSQHAAFEVLKTWSRNVRSDGPNLK